MSFAPLIADASSNLLAARNQMAFTLGFHIILACLGVAFPAIMLVAHYRGLKHDDKDALKLAERWSRGVAVLFAVGAVTGTVLSFEMGLLWPEVVKLYSGYRDYQERTDREIPLVILEPRGGTG